MEEDVKQIEVPAHLTGPSRQKSLPVTTHARIDASNLPLGYDHMADTAVPDSVACEWTIGKMPVLLRRPMTSEERGWIERRVGLLEPAMMPYARPEEDDRVAQALAMLFDSYRQMRGTEEEAVARVWAVMTTLAPMPAWAIEEACLTIRRHGYERKDDAGRVKLEQHWPPGDAEIFAACERVARPRMEALAKAKALLTADVSPAQAKRQGRSVDVVLAEYQTQVGPAEVDAREAEAIRERRSRETCDRTIEDRRQEYVRAGLAAPEGRIFASLPMMLKNGYMIETIKGERVLVGPAGAGARNPLKSESKVGSTKRAMPTPEQTK